jgi:hypothetical protein
MNIALEAILGGTLLISNTLVDNGPDLVGGLIIMAAIPSRWCPIPVQPRFKAEH